MALGKATYILRFKNGATREMLVQFAKNETVRENLARILPSAIQQGFLPETCSADTVELDHKERTLNLDLPLGEQGVHDYDVLVLRDLSSMIRIVDRYKADDNEPAMESVTLPPNEVLKTAFGDFGAKMRREYTFYGRKVKKFHLIHGKRKLNLKKSPRALGIKEDIEVRFKPRILFEWPPRFVWPPGPFTAWLLSTILVAAVVVLVLLFTRKPTPLTRFKVTLECKNAPCKIYDGEGTLVANDRFTDYYDVGEYRFRIYPKEYPVIDTLIVLETDLTGADSLRHVVIDPTEKYKDSPDVRITILGFAAEKRHERLNSALKGIELTVMINKFEYPTDEFSRFPTMLYRGMYEIKFSLADTKFRECVVVNEGSRTKQDNFYFDLSDPAYTGNTIMNFYYSIR